MSKYESFRQLNPRNREPVSTGHFRWYTLVQLIRCIIHTILREVASWFLPI